MVQKNTFAWRFAEAIEKRGLTQDKVAKSLSTSKSLVSNWTNGKTIPALKNAKKLSKLLKVSVEYLLTGKEEPDIYSEDNNNDNRDSRKEDMQKHILTQLGYIMDNGSDEDIEAILGKIGKVYFDTKLKKDSPHSKR